MDDANRAMCFKLGKLPTPAKFCNFSGVVLFQFSRLYLSSTGLVSVLDKYNLEKWKRLVNRKTLEPATTNTKNKKMPQPGHQQMPGDLDEF